MAVGIKIGRGFTVTGEGKLRRKAKGATSVSEKIRQRKSKRVRVVGKMKAMLRAQKP